MISSIIPTLGKAAYGVKLLGSPQHSIFDRYDIVDAQDLAEAARKLE